MRRRVTLKSNERRSDLFSGQTSKQYSSMGRHLVFTRCRKTSSDADLPSLPNKAFTDLKKERLACVYLCKCVDCRNLHAANDYTALSSTPSAVANAAASLTASECPCTPRGASDATALKDGGEQSATLMSESELESLCAGYGGYVRAKRAATIIQQTYRQYSMSRSFAKLRLEAGESRRSRRFARRRGADCSRHQDSMDVDRSLDLSQLCDEDSRAAADVQQTAGDAAVQSRDAPAAPDSADVAAVLAAADTAAEKSSSDEFQGHDDLDDGDDDRSGGGGRVGERLRLLPPPMPLPAPSDLPSVCFESSLEDEMSSCGGRRHEVCPGPYSVQDCMFSVCPAAYSVDPRECHDHGTYFEHRSSLHCYHAGLNCRSRTKHRTDRTNAGLVTTTRYPDETFRRSRVFQPPSSSFARFGLLSDHAEPSPIWKRKSGSVDSYDTGVGTGLEEWDMDVGRSGQTDRPWSELYPGSTTSSEDTGSIGSAGETAALQQNRHHHTTADGVNQSVNSASSKRSSVLSAASDQQRKRAYRIGLNLFNR